MWELVKLSLRAIAAHRMRSVLSMLGIGIGPPISGMSYLQSTNLSRTPHVAFLYLSTVCCTHFRRAELRRKPGGGKESITEPHFRP